MPASARIRVTMAGDTLNDVFGRGIDADADGVSGGISEFDTLSLTIVSNTIVCGRVFASEQVPVAGTNQWVNNPLEGVTVDGLESNVFAITDNLGDFRLEHTPVGRFFVHINGVTATLSGEMLRKQLRRWRYRSGLFVFRRTVFGCNRPRN
ncbi:MAG: hypothetical protein GKR87_00215 [Kiritimatiellae bacterium]|nr:hypothetical protein [Kiritimatiellia bacterium]